MRYWFATPSHNPKTCRFGLLYAVLLCFVAILPPHAAEAQTESREDLFKHIKNIFTNVRYLRDQEPELPTYEELVYLSDHPKPGGTLQRKVDRVFRTPVVSNWATRSGIRPHRPRDPRLGTFLRAVSWNIEKSLKLDEAIQAFTSPKDFALLIDTDRFPAGAVEHEETLAERYLLDYADIIILQEMDVGMKRSGYRNSPKELAEALKMNYAYVPAYLEIDKVNLGIEDFRNADGTLNQEMARMIEVDPKRYRGLFGSAVLSRYPIVKVEVIPLIHQGYDWYEGEKQRSSLLEKVRRTAAESVFLETLLREMKIGGRHYFRVDLYVPDLPEKRLTVINVHLEIKCLPEARERQMFEILDYIREIRNPVILMGDFNASPGDLSPTTVKREARRLLSNPSFWFSQALRVATPQGMALDVSRVTSNLTKNFQNPTALHIPVIAPNKLQNLFKMIRHFRFDDGYVFDFRGEHNRSINQKGKLLANSNERDRIGYKMTFTTERTIFQVIGKYRLDWAFVKPYLTDPLGRQQSYRLAPHFGRTLEALNDRLKERISDHHPNLVDLPFEEPLTLND